MDASGKQTSKVAGKSLLSHSFFTIDHPHHYQQLHTLSRIFMFGAGINTPSPPWSHSKVVLTVDVVDDAVDALPHLAPAQSKHELTFAPQQSNPAASTSTSTMTLSQRLLRTSALSAPARRVSDTLALPSTALSHNSCSREVTSPVATFVPLLYNNT